MSSTSIEWTDATWNPVIGCTPVSPGCLNCYAATMARRLEAMGRPEYAPRRVGDGVPYGDRNTIRIAEVRGGRAVFTGEVRCLPERLQDPLRWRKPRRVFVNSMSDLFHEAVPFEFIDRVFAVMALCPQHTFQVLTKRPERMATYLGVNNRRACIADEVRVLRLLGYGNAIDDPCVQMKLGGFDLRQWPLPNVWLGTSVENQRTADERTPILAGLGRAGWTTFVSQEPQIGPVAYRDEWADGLDQIIVGGESGKDARAFDVAWAYVTLDWCRSRGVAFFLKQLGALISGQIDHPDNEGYGVHGVRLKDRKGGDPSEWPDDLRVREMPGGAS